MFGSTSQNSRAEPGGWTAATIRFRVFTVSPFDAVLPDSVALVGGHDGFEKTGAELGELAEELRLSAFQKAVRPLHVPAWLPFALA